MVACKYHSPSQPCRLRASFRLSRTISQRCGKSAHRRAAAPVGMKLPRIMYRNSATQKLSPLQQRTDGAQAVVPVVVAHQRNAARRKTREGAFDGPFAVVIERFGRPVQIRDHLVQNG